MPFCNRGGMAETPSNNYSNTGQDWLDLPGKILESAPVDTRLDPKRTRTGCLPSKIDIPYHVPAADTNREY